MNKAIIAAGLFLCLASGAHAQGKLPKTGMPMPPAPAKPAPQKPVYWSNFFDDMFDDSLDVTAAANARSADELSRDGWNKGHGTKDAPKDKPKGK